MLERLFAQTKGLPNRNHSFMAAPSVLVVEDQADSRILLKQVLEERHCKILEAEYKNVLELAEKTLPDLILISVGRPRYEGWAIIRQLQEQQTLCQIPIVATSSNASSTFQNALIVAGCSAYLPKPIDCETLDHLLERYLSNIYLH